jgi:sialate O-acetylesterase
MSFRALVRTAAIALSVLAATRAEVGVNPLFSDHAVLQAGREVPVWGTARDGEKVTVSLAGGTAAATAQSGRWLVRLPPMPAGGPYTLTVAGEANTVTVQDVLVGEVWICSGQSNMERQLGLREGQKPITNWREEVTSASYPLIRHFGVTQKAVLSPETGVAGQWIVCSPDTVESFTAVGFFFGRGLFQARKVPIGLIHSSWGGTPAEAWTSLDALQKMPEFAEAAAQVERTAAELKTGAYNYPKQLEGWFAKNDPGAVGKPAWWAPELEERAWEQQVLPGLWEAAGLPGFDGVVWFRRTIDLPESWTGADAELHLGMIDDADTTWVNGIQAGATSGYQIPRIYRVPAAVLKPGRNVIAVRVLDTGGGGGLWGGADSMRLVSLKSGEGTAIPLTGPWSRKVSASLAKVPFPPLDFSRSPATPSSLYNGMIAPLLPYAMRGVIWYQGEANVGREKQYRTLLPAMISDWRRVWGEGDFPFLFVQIAPHKGMTPEIREAQLLASQRTPNTAMAVTIDCGDADDIHPAYKQPVGARLALAARALAYGEKIEYSGPVFASAQFAGSRAVLRFTHLGGGLVAKDGALIGFTIAGADKVFHAANAVIEDGTVAVSAPEVPQPAAVRYGWANVPVGNLFNAAGLPASPFRTDVD